MSLTAERLPESPFLYPPEERIDLPSEVHLAELIREQILRRTHDEIPHAVEVRVESVERRPDGLYEVRAQVWVETQSQKAILIGEKGSRIRAIGQSARIELTKLLERPVHLFLNVKEREGWDEERARIRAIGLEDAG